jgi:lipoprotein-anchoring transpeptidase ErfK/SrfK
LSANRYEIVRARALFAGCLVFALSACGGAPAPTHQATAPRRASPAHCRAGYHTLGTSRLAYAAIVKSHVDAVRRPGARRLARFARLNVNGVPTVFGVLGARRTKRCADTWYRVQLPVRPNGVTGWIPAAAATIAAVRTRVVVDLSTRRLTLFRNGRRVLSAAVAVGSPATPTPTGRYYVNQRLIPADPNGPFGPGAVGISAFSNVLTGWTQGGPVAIHGTDAPWSIGHDVSNGCIRLPNATLRKVFAAALAGTPVVIRR